VKQTGGGDRGHGLGPTSALLLLPKGCRLLLGCFSPPNLWLIGFLFPGPILADPGKAWHIYVSAQLSSGLDLLGQRREREDNRGGWSVPGLVWPVPHGGWAHRTDVSNKGSVHQPLYSPGSEKEKVSMVPMCGQHL
jgi:hypothetical protein